jgi:putative ABC transport system ATP-binding protein
VTDSDTTGDQQIDPASGSADAPVVACRGITHYFGQGDYRQQALVDVTLTIPPGEVVWLKGPRGSGKSTLLRLIGALLPVQEGQLQVLGTNMESPSAGQRRELRRQIGYVFAIPALIESLTTAQNIAIGLGQARLPARERHERVQQAIEMLELHSRAHCRPLYLSKSQRQRVAIARALVQRPRLVLADEPTTEVDDRSAADFGSLLRTMAKDHQMTSIVIMRDGRIGDVASRVVMLMDGRIKE